MSAILGAEETIEIGTAIQVDSGSPTGPYAAFFEDDGTTGYFYGLDQAREGNPIVDALHIYNVAQVTDKHIPSLIQIVWSSDGLKTALLINDFPHAVFDFEGRRAYCRTGFPPADGEWSNYGHDWDDRAMELFQ